MEKTVDADAEYVTTFEETLQRFVGLSSEEIWELQRILVRRVRCKISESLSPEGKTAMKQVKQEMHERRIELEKRGISSATLVTELFDLGSRQDADTPNQNAEVTDIVLTTPDVTDKPADDSHHAGDEIDRVADDNNKESPSGEENKVAEDGTAKDTITVADDTAVSADDSPKENGSPMERAESRSSSRKGDKPDTNVDASVDHELTETEENSKSDVIQGDPKPEETSKDGSGNSQIDGDAPSGQRSLVEGTENGEKQETDNGSEEMSASKLTENGVLPETENVGTTT